MLGEVLSINDLEYVSSKKIKKIQYMVLGLYLISALNMIMLFSICGIIAIYAPRVNSVVTLINDHKSQLNTTISLISNIADTIDKYF
uniref:Uncharacterized protein n=1 Tax=Pithovirus LCPAC101 TaxID=2506586 RepID=A0A481Z3X6_9VIRU|nr:MAG: hypothetical protein LCPAC101_00210 [Pithovirus LCPAC101]